LEKLILLWEAYNLRLFARIKIRMNVIKNGAVAVGTALVLSALQVQAEVKWDISADAMLDATSYRGYLFPSDSQEAYLRRAKAAAKFEFSPLVSAKMSVEYDYDKALTVDDFYLLVNPAKDYGIYLGKFKEPSGLAKSGSLKAQTFTERSIATNIFSFGRKSGAKLAANGGFWAAEAAVMQAEADEAGVDDGRVTAFKATVNPYRSENKKAFAHLGVSYSQRDSTERRFDLNEPMLVPTLGNLLRSPNYDAERIATTSVEFAAAYKKWLFQTEHYQQGIDEFDGDEYQHSGYYASLSWAIKGKSREYRGGKIKLANKNKPLVELALRVSEVDMRERNDGDKAEVFTASANYYFKQHYRVVLEYEFAERERHDDGFVTLTDGDAVKARFQINF